MKVGLLESNVYPVPSPGDVIHAPLDLVAALANGLPKVGVQATLFAASDSKVNCPVVSANLPSLYSKAGAGGFHATSADEAKKVAAYENVLIAAAYKHAEKENFDLIHSHPLGQTLPFSAEAQLPTIFTLHIPLKKLTVNDEVVPTFIDDQLAILQQYGQHQNHHFVSISNAQRQAMPNLNYAATVYNGIDVDDFNYSPRPAGNYYGLLGRIVEEKGFDKAIAAARAAGVTFRLAGQPSKSRPEYWEKKIKPLVNNKSVFYDGLVKGQARQQFLSNAKALLFPIQWEEPFGLVLIEAMGSGTPVIAFDRGSVAEVVKDGVTGFVCPANDMSAFVAAIKKLEAMPAADYQVMRRACRQHVLANFTTDHMIQGYKNVYQKVVDDYGKSGSAGRRNRGFWQRFY